MKLVIIFFSWLLFFFQIPAKSFENCDAPILVCKAATRVFAISSDDPLASAVLIEPGILVTNRHPLADRKFADIFLPDGSQIRADVIPTSYPGDLMLLSIKGLDHLDPLIFSSELRTDTEFFSVGADIGRGKRIRVYNPGHILSLPAPGKPLARIHHTSPSQPGNSGGALVNREGKLVGIITSGGEGRYEAIPVQQIEWLKKYSGTAYLDDSKRAGVAYKKCKNAIKNALSSRTSMNSTQVDFLFDRCKASSNRQLFDLAGQALGKRGHYQKAIDFFNLSLLQDPNALNSRISMVVTLHIAGKYSEESSHLKYLMKVLPSDLQVIRFAIQSGLWSNNKDLTKRGIALLRKYHPKLLPLVEKLKKTPPPRKKNKVPSKTAPQ